MSAAASAVRGRVIVVGSLNIDRLWRVPRLPVAGETLHATATRVEFGGKGANQAVAAARHRASVALVGAVGADADGDAYRAHLAAEGVDASHVATIAGASTGAAFICVDDRGENQIVVAAGANGHVSAEHAGRAVTALAPAAKVLLAGLECPVAAALAALRAAAAAGLPTLLNPSPVARDFPWGEVPVGAVIVNEHECAEIFGRPQPAELARRKVTNLIVTRGAEPTLWINALGRREFPAHPVRPVDTVGAGDAFAGTLAARLAEGDDFPRAIAVANIAAALSTLGPGAQGPVPPRAAVEAVLAGRG
jgi:ribokinase